MQFIYRSREGEEREKREKRERKRLYKKEEKCRNLQREREELNITGRNLQAINSTFPQQQKFHHPTTKLYETL